MLMKIFTVFDSKVEAYLPPFFLPTTGAAVRAFTDAVSDGTHQFCKHPADYTLFQIGIYDDQTGHMEAMQNFQNLGTALEYMSKAANIPQNVVPIKGEKK